MCRRGWLHAPTRRVQRAHTHTPASHLANPLVLLLRQVTNLDDLSGERRMLPLAHTPPQLPHHACARRRAQLRLQCNDLLSQLTDASLARGQSTLSMGGVAQLRPREASAANSVGLGGAGGRAGGRAGGWAGGWE